MNTGEKIKYFRLAHGITQEQLAQDAEISHSTLRKYLLILIFALCPICYH